MLENIISFSSQQKKLDENENREIQLSVALSSIVYTKDISCRELSNGYKYKGKTVSEILEAEKARLENLKSGIEEQNSELDERINKRKSDFEYLPKEIAHGEFIVDELNLGNLILMDASFMHKNDEEFKNLEMNDGIRVYIFCDKENESLCVLSKGTAPGEFSILPDMIFPSEKKSVIINQEEKKDDLIGINGNDKDEKSTIKNKNEDELREFAIAKQNIIFNNIASELLEPYMDENGDFKNEWKNIYFFGHSSGGNKVMNLFANKILNSQDPNKELERCKCICINSIGWAQETKNYFEEQFKEKEIDFKEFCNRVTDVKGSTDPISVINENPIGKTVFMESKGHYTEDIDINQFLDSPDRKYYMYAQFFAYIKDYLSGIKNSMERDEKIRTTLKVVDYWGCGKLMNVLGECITTYRTKVFIIVLLVLLKNYVKALFVVYVFRIEPIINNNQNEFMTNFPNQEQESFIDNIINETVKTEDQKQPSSDLDESQPNLNFT